MIRRSSPFDDPLPIALGRGAQPLQQHAVRGSDDKLQRQQRAPASCSNSTRSPASRWPRSRCRTILPITSSTTRMASRSLPTAPSGSPQPNSQQHRPPRWQRQRDRQLTRRAPRCRKAPSVRADGNVYFSGFDSSGNGVYLLDTSSGSTSLSPSPTVPTCTKIAATGGVWAATTVDAALRFDDSAATSCNKSATTARTRPRAIRLVVGQHLDI